MLEGGAAGVVRRVLEGGDGEGGCRREVMVIVEGMVEEVMERMVEGCAIRRWWRGVLVGGGGGVCW